MSHAARRPDPRRDLDDDDAPIRRAGRKRGWSSMKLALAITAGVVLLAGVILTAVVLVSRSAPVSDVQGRTWDLGDVTKFLNSKGLKVQASSVGYGQRSCQYESVLYQEPPELVLDYRKGDFVPKHTLSVTCTRFATPEDAKIDTELDAKKGIRSFAWGRFVFSGGPPAFRDHIQRVLLGGS